MINLEIMQAINSATRIYDGLKREGSGLPYIVHPFSVFLIVGQHTDDTPTRIAALFHDFFKKSIPKGAKGESGTYDYSDLVTLIGIPAARLVDEISHYRDRQISQETDWRTSKYEALNDFDNLSSKAKTIFVANQIHNLFSLVEDYKNTKAKLWEIFGASEELMALYYADIMEKVIASFHNSIVTDYYDIFLEACRLFGWRITYEEAVKSLVWAKEFKEE